MLFILFIGEWCKLQDLKEITAADSQKAAGKNFTRIFWKKILIFLAFEFVFSAITMPLLIFYGPFGNVKQMIVGMSWNSYRHQYISKFFLSDEAIQKIVGKSYAVDPTDDGAKINLINITVHHTDKIDVFNIDGGDFNGKLMVIYDPTRIALGYTAQLLKAGETASSIAKRYGAVAAINAGGFLDVGWAGTGGVPDGFIINNGKVVYNDIGDDDLKQDTAAFTEKGQLIVGKHSINQLLKEYKVKDAIKFGPPLIVNGKPTITEGNGGWGIAPRTAIAQKETGEIMLIVIDGRDPLHGIIGATLRDVQDILLKNGAVNAVNLDGGSSTTMYYNGKVINKPSDGMGERSLSTVFMVLPMKEGIK